MVATSKTSPAAVVTEPRTDEPPARRWARDGAAAFLIYLVLSIAVFALPVIGDLGNRCVGSCVRDFKLYVWAFDWFRHAVATGSNPFFTPLIWAPDGTSLTWVTTLPAPSLLILPVTAIFGPIVSANVLLILAPTLAGWAMYLVCRQITERFWPAVVGGAVFAFSTYVGHLMRAQLNLLLMFWVPLGIYLILRYVRGTMSKRRFVVLFGLVLLGEFLTSTEVFAMATFIGALALGAFALWGGEGSRTAIKDLLKPLLISYVAVGVLLLPLAIPTLLTTPDTVLRPTEQNSADLVGYVVPGYSTRIGSGEFESLSSRFLDPDNFAYVGIAFIAIVVMFAIGARKRPATVPLVVLFATGLILSAGPRLHIFGDRNLWLPGWLVHNAPLLQHAVPLRFVMYAWLPLAAIVALWLADARGRASWWKYGLAVLAIVAVLPSNVSTRDVVSTYHDELDHPPFFEDGTFREQLAEDEIVLAIPHGVGDEMLWQVRSGMAFRLASAYIGPTKPKNGLGNLSQEEPPPDPDDFASQLEEAEVTTIVAADPITPEWQLFLQAATGSTGTPTGGVVVFPVSSPPPSA